MQESGAAPSKSVNNDSAKPRRNGMILVISAVDMSWRLAIAVLVPIIGGYELDKHFTTTPVLTIIGFIIAMVGLFVVLKRTIALADAKFISRSKR